MTYTSQTLRGFICAAIMAIMVVSTNVLAQEEFHTGEAGKNSLIAGSKAFLFEVDGLLNIDFSGFNGATLSYKFHSSSRKAYRIGLSLSGSVSDGDVFASSHRTSINFAIPDTNISSISTSGPNQSENLVLDINVVRLFYSSVNQKVSGFIGLGPAVGVRWLSTSTSNLAVTPSTSSTIVSERIQTSDRKDKGWNIGVNGLVGVEWFVRTNISFMSEFGSTLAYDWSRSERTDIRIDEIYDTVSGPITRIETTTFSHSKNRGLLLRNSVVRLGLSVYF